jgi:eukaryotic-like serine/threonine-protein kinase
MSTEPRRLGKYELRERLARGGQGEVWKAYDTGLRRYIAIKLLHADMESDPDFVSRFEREARFIASLRHPNIVQIHDFQFIQNPVSGTTTAYMVMDFIEGQTLADYIRNTSRKMQFPPAADIVYIFTGVSLAIDYAHSRDMIHRDIKPANILLDQRMTGRNAIGVPVLTDFGIAKLQGVSVEKTQVLGTPLYVSPEQAQRLPGDKRSDLYSLGIILYEMTTGITPFRGDSLLAILMQHFQELPTPPALINPNIPPALSEVILKSIAKDPDARFQSASAMTIALAEALNVPMPVELLRPVVSVDIGGQDAQELKDGGAINRVRADPTSNPLQPAQLNMTPIPASLADRSAMGEAGAEGLKHAPLRSAEAMGAINRPLRGIAGGGLEGVSFSRPDAHTPAGVLTPSSQVATPEGVRQPARQKRKLYIVLIALLVAIVAGAGLVYALLVPKGTTAPPPANVVMGQVRFLSSANATPAGSIDEVQVTIQHIPNAPAGEHYYAWLQSGSEGSLLIHWELIPQNGSLTSSYPNPQHNNLLANNPYLFLITVETADNGTPSFDPHARLYYAQLKPPIQNSTSFSIRQCPQSSSSNVCFS